VLTPRGEIATPKLNSIAEVMSGRPAAGATIMPAAVPATAPDSAELEREIFARYDHRPLARLLGQRTRQPAIANRIARAILKEATHLQVAPSLLTGMLLTENARLDAKTVSSQGAIGLMQVMHFHAGEFDCESDDLVQVEANICHGAHVFGSYLQRTGDLRRALLRYNGCVTGSNTPGCQRYPAKVLRTARLIRHQLLLYPPYQLASDSTEAGAQGSDLTPN
jgi:soluble lytic murein transglycosylase-like protein